VDRVAVRRVVPPGNSLPLEPGHELLLPESEEGAKPPPLARGHSCETGRSAARQDTKQDGLQLVVLVMCEDHRVRPLLPTHLLEPAVPRDPGPRFGGAGPEAEATYRDRHGDVGHRGHHAIGDGAAVGMNAVVRVRHDEIEPMALPGRVHQVEEGERVGPAGDGQQETPPGSGTAHRLPRIEEARGRSSVGNAAVRGRSGGSGEGIRES